MADIATLYQLANYDGTEDALLTADISGFETNPANVSLWATGDYVVGDWVRYDDAGTVYTYYCIQDTTAQQVPTDTAYWQQMWESAAGWPGIPLVESVGVTRTFDGAFHTLSDFYLNGSAGGGGIFEYLTSDNYSRLIKDLYITGLDSTITLPGGALNRTVLESFTVQNVSIEGALTCPEASGGIANYIYGTITNCKVDLAISSSGDRRVGGLGCFIRETAVITDCYVTGSIAMDAATSDTSIAGFAAVPSQAGLIERCFAAVAITNASNANGFAGSGACHIANCYWDTDVGPATSAEGIGKTTAEMQDIDTYTTGTRTETETGEAVGTGDGATTTFSLYFTPVVAASETVYLDGSPTTAYTLTDATGEIVFDTAPGVGVVITADYQHELAAWDMVASHDGQEATATWFIVASSYPALWYEYAYAANDFSGDPDVIAVYRFESSALTIDSKGSNDLTVVGSPTADAVNFQEGAASVELDPLVPDYFTLADAAMGADYPLKNGTTNDVFSVMYWFSDSAENRSAIVGKYEISTDDRSIVIRHEGNSINIYIGHTSGTDFEILYSAAPLVDAIRWHHLKFTFDNSTGAWTLRIYELIGDTVLVNASGIATNSIAIVETPWVFGSYAPVSGSEAYQWGGWIDEIIFAKRVVSNTDQDAIIAGTYSGSGTPDPTGSPVVMAMMQMNQLAGGI